MRRISVLVGTWTSVAIIAGVCLAADPKRPGNQPAAPVSPQAAPAAGGLRYVTPPSNSGNYINTNRRAVEARRAAQSAAAAQQAAAAAKAPQNAAAAHSVASSTQQTNSSQQASYPNSPYGYGYGSFYSPYGYYSPYAYSYWPYGYIPPGTNPYVLGYNPLTGTGALYPYAGSSYSSYYPQYSYQYPYYGNSYLGYGYPMAVFVPADQLYGLGPILQLMGLNQ
ncbi:MAG: hypothetical protein ACLP9L_24625 [Thermoguttaceae bacterium]